MAMSPPRSKWQTGVGIGVLAATCHSSPKWAEMNRSELICPGQQAASSPSTLPLCRLPFCSEGAGRVSVGVLTSCKCFVLFCPFLLSSTSGTGVLPQMPAGDTRGNRTVPSALRCPGGQSAGRLRASWGWGAQPSCHHMSQLGGTVRYLILSVSTLFWIKHF